MAFITLEMALISPLSSLKMGHTHWDLPDHQGPYSVENTMPANEWFTPNPYEVKESISTARWSSFRRGLLSMTDAAWS